MVTEKLHNAAKLAEDLSIFYYKANDLRRVVEGKYELKNSSIDTNYFDGYCISAVFITTIVDLHPLDIKINVFVKSPTRHINPIKDNIKPILIDVLSENFKELEDIVERQGGMFNEFSSMIRKELELIETIHKTMS